MPVARLLLPLRIPQSPLRVVLLILILLDLVISGGHLRGGLILNIPRGDLLCLKVLNLGSSLIGVYLCLSRCGFGIALSEACGGREDGRSKNG